MHLILRLPRGVDDAALAEALSGRDLWPSPLSRFGVAIPAGPGLLIGFTNVPTSEAAQCANRLRKAIGR
jgi:DNA-binding transcriptional MocR family regulator